MNAGKVSGARAEPVDSIENPCMLNMSWVLFLCSIARVALHGGQRADVRMDMTFPIGWPPRGNLMSSGSSCYRS